MVKKIIYDSKNCCSVSSVTHEALVFIVMDGCSLYTKVFKFRLMNQNIKKVKKQKLEKEY